MTVSSHQPKTRHWILALLLQIGIRLRYFCFESCFGLIPLTSPLTAYPSPYRPKNCPKYDFLTQTGFIWLWFITAFSRDLIVPYVVFAKIGVLTVFNWIHEYLTNRLIGQFKKAGYSTADREIPIPEYDWKKGNPEVFYQSFVKKPHPVILRGFMKDAQLLKDMSWDNVLKKYGDEDVFLTKRELDGFPGKLREVDNPKIYLHNSEKLFNKYPQIK
jgi:hypothetical protein